MTVAATRVSAAALAFALMAPAAWADITAEEAWAQMKSYMTLSGYEASGTEAKSGNTLTISDLALTMTMPEDAGTAAINLSSLSFVENGDGTVSVTFPEEMPMTMQGAYLEGGQIEAKYLLKDSKVLMSGTVDNMTIDTDFGALSYIMKVDAEGEADLDLNVTMSDIAGQTKVTKAEALSYTQSMTMNALSYVMDVDATEEGGKARLEGAVNDVTWDGIGVLPKTVTQPVDVAQMVRDGMSGKGEIRFKSGTGGVTGTGEGGEFAMQGTSGEGVINIELDKDKMAFGGVKQNTTMTVQSAQVPFPVSMQMAESGFTMEMPVSKSDEAQPFALNLTLGGFTVADQLWGMFDPAGKLPRDPANVRLDLVGTGKLGFDLFDQAAIEAMETGNVMPGELNTVSIKDLEVSIAGASLTGLGDFTFNNAGPAPEPIGSANLKLVGANSLIDTLVDMGLVSAENAMGARMMMGMLAVPGEGEDTLTSTIELGEGGKVFANGQRLK